MGPFLSMTLPQKTFTISLSSITTAVSPYFCPPNSLQNPSSALTNAHSKKPKQKQKHQTDHATLLLKSPQWLISHGIKTRPHLSIQPHTGCLPQPHSAHTHSLGPGPAKLFPVPQQLSVCPASVSPPCSSFLCPDTS